MANDEIYYAHAGALPLARRLSYIARARIVDQILAILKPTASTTLLDIGTSDNTSFESNMMQQRYPYRESMTCASLSDGLTITQAYPGVKHVRIQPNVRLPFCDGQFDCAYSNAVIEHCGNRTQQSFFIDEVCRVSRSQFIIAPNPYFPVEHHTGLPLLHLLPKRVFRFILSQSKWCYWSTEQNQADVPIRSIAGSDMAYSLQISWSIKLGRRLMKRVVEVNYEDFFNRCGGLYRE